MTGVQTCALPISVISWLFNSVYRSDAVKIQKRLYTESLKFVEKYNVGEKAISDLSNIFVRFFIYGMSDLYSCSGMDFSSCKCELKSWVNDKELHKASEHATLTEIQYKIINSFLRNKKIDVLHGIFVIRSKMRNEDPTQPQINKLIKKKKSS